MALVKCKDCGAEVSKNAKACPKCGAPPPAGISIVRIIIGVIVVLVGIPIAIGLAATLGGKATTAVASAGMADIHDQVARDSVAQYEIAKRGTNAIQTCVQAGMVVAAFLQAKNEPEVRRWQAVEQADCAAAGMPKP